MHQRYWSNPEFKRNLVITAITAIITIAAAFTCFMYGAQSLKNELIRSNSAVAGVLIQKHPELKDEIMSAFTEKAGDTQLAAGAAAAKEHGYDESLPISFVPVINSFCLEMAIPALLLLTVFLLLFGLILYLTHASFYRRIRETASAAERIVEGDFSSRLDEGEEGDLSKLSHHFNQMARVLEHSIEQLKNDKTYLRNMISDISHQLKTPLSSIKVYNEILQNTAVQYPSEGQEFLKRTEEQIERMEWLVKNLLLLARLESGVTEFNYVNSPIYEVLENAVEILRDKWETGGIHMHLSASDKGAVLKADPDWLTEAVSNIIKNSIEHTPRGGNIHISLEASAVMARVVIEDDGEGIGSEDLPHIFQRFYRGRDKRAGSGTGIGLALAKAIITNHNGIISVASKKGSGTTFTITFQRL